MGFTDLMISVKRALPKPGTEVIARVEEHHITPLVYDKGWPMRDVISWVWKSKTRKCSCHKLRWNKKSLRSGKCPKCGTRWIKP